MKTHDGLEILMVEVFKFSLFVLGLLLLSATTSSYGESSTCLMVYKEGGAPAVFQSPKCPRWKLSDYASRPPSTARCQIAMMQGRRKSQEDRAICALDLRIPFPGSAGIKDVTVGIMAVFDGHNGAEASEMSSKLLLEYFVVHTYFLLDATYSSLFTRSTGKLPDKREIDAIFHMINWNGEIGRHLLDIGRFKYSLPADFDDSFHLEMLKESLLRAIHDIDATFSREASRRNLDSGSTATIILIANAQVLVANIGDSKAFLCSEKFQSPAEAKATFLRLYRKKRQNGDISHTRETYKTGPSNGLVRFLVKELTRDHHPDRDDEKSRVETAGGHVIERGGIPRVNGQLAISRAIGDVSFKSYGVISSPEVTDWQPLTANDSYLIAASDGVFEKLSSQDVCDLLWDVHNHDSLSSELSSSCAYSLADCIVDTAFEKGSMDNVAAIVVPLGSTGISKTLQEEDCVGEGDKAYPISGLRKAVYDLSVDVPSYLVQLEHAHPAMSKLKRLLVERKNSNFGCFYLSENLDEYKDYTCHDQNEDLEDFVFDPPQALPDVIDQHFGGSLNVYTEQNICFHLGFSVDGIKDQCINPQGFANFLGLLESIPFHNGASNHESNEYSMPDMRYVLKKRFGRGSYGEVWLAYNWNCREGNNDTNGNGKNDNTSFDSNVKDNSSSNPNCQAGHPPEDNLFIMKRIMVERGPAFYLSGLREKYFGEVFLNASTCLGGMLSAEIPDTFSEESRFGFFDPLVENESMLHEIGNTRGFDRMFPNQFRSRRPIYEEGLSHVARYVESFESRSKEIWLVFRHEGISLSKLIYTVDEIDDTGEESERVEQGKHFQILRPSKWWHWLKTTKAGQEQMRHMIWQLLMALKSCHDRNITHRDIKLENMVICFEDPVTGKCFLKGSPSGEESFMTKVRIIDFGSSIDEFTLKHLYGPTGPSRAEQTYEYSPPEALLNSTWYQETTSTTLKYDMWSVGVVMLELILGSPNVFIISSYTRTLLDQHLDGWSGGLKELAYKLRSFMELCILTAGSSSKHHQRMDQPTGMPASWKCSEEVFSHYIKRRDPLKLGFPNIQALRLVRHLLLWNPEDRFSVDDALQHPYFNPPPKG